MQPELFFLGDAFNCAKPIVSNCEKVTKVARAGNIEITFQSSGGRVDVVVCRHADGTHRVTKIKIAVKGSRAPVEAMMDDGSMLSEMRLGLGGLARVSNPFASTVARLIQSSFVADGRTNHIGPVQGRLAALAAA
jgi:hypothetical protein